MEIFTLLIFLCRVLSANSYECGKQKSALGLIYGGTSVTKGEWPWLVALLKSNNDEYFCSSNLISDRHLLTAAHCVYEKQATRGFLPEDIYAYVGRYDISKSKYEQNSVKEDIKYIKVHPDWNPRDIRYDADIAVLTLKDRVIFSETIQPVCLPDNDIYSRKVTGVVVGYGRSESNAVHENTPRKVQISSFTNDECFFKDFHFARVGSPRTFCAGERGKTPCQGDSGAGFLIDVRSSWQISGIVSSALVQECGASDFVLLSNVAKYTDWIKDEMNHDENNSFEQFFNSLHKSPIKDVSNSLTAVNGDCSFETSGSYYGCYMNSLNAPDKDIELHITPGSHKLSRSNRDVTVMQIKDGYVTHFPDLTHVLETFPNMMAFGIVFTKLKHIERSKLRNLGEIKYFLISDNELEVIPPDTFLDLKKIELIDICRNKIKQLSAEWLSTMTNLKIFKARSNKFEMVPANMFQNNLQLEEILLDKNDIKRSDVDFMKMKKLKIVAILNNPCINLKYCKEADGKESCIQSLEQFYYIVRGYCGEFNY